MENRGREHTLVFFFALPRLLFHRGTSKLIFREFCQRARPCQQKKSASHDPSVDPTTPCVFPRQVVIYIPGQDTVVTTLYKICQMLKCVSSILARLFFASLQNCQTHPNYFHFYFARILRRMENRWIHLGFKNDLNKACLKNKSTFGPLRKTSMPSPYQPSLLRMYCFPPKYCTT
jgi:hypothetical protein